MLFRGSGVALVTPFKEDESIDFERLEELVNFHLENGTDAILPIGTTGESVTLTKEEKLQVVQKCVQVVDGRIPVIPGCSTNDTKESVDFTKEVSKLGIDGLLAVTPYYNRANEEGLYLHYEAIAQATDLPIILYNVPARTGVNLTVGVIKRLVENYDNIQGLKDATGNLAYTVNVKYNLGKDKDFFIYSGNDDVVVPLLSVGGDGVISVSANIIPKETHDMCQAFFDGDIEKAADHQIKYYGLIDSLFLETNPIPVKYAMERLGMIGANYRLPLCQPSQGVKDILDKELSKLGLVD